MATVAMTSCFARLACIICIIVYKVMVAMAKAVVEAIIIVFLPF
jgi:hypothetical protein